MKYLLFKKHRWKNRSHIKYLGYTCVYLIFVTCTCIYLIFYLIFVCLALVSLIVVILWISRPKNISLQIYFDLFLKKHSRFGEEYAVASLSSRKRFELEYIVIIEKYTWRETLLIIYDNMQ